MGDIGCPMSGEKYEVGRTKYDRSWFCSAACLQVAGRYGIFSL